MCTCTHHDGREERTFKISINVYDVVDPNWNDKVQCIVFTMTNQIYWLGFGAYHSGVVLQTDGVALGIPIFIEPKFIVYQNMLLVATHFLPQVCGLASLAELKAAHGELLQNWERLVCLYMN